MGLGDFEELMAPRWPTSFEAHQVFPRAVITARKWHFSLVKKNF
jgi:hypothetical protein